MTEQKEKRYPDFTVVEAEDVGRGKTHWHTLGAAWWSKSGESLTLQLDAHPVGRRMCLFKPKTDEEDTVDAETGEVTPSVPAGHFEPLA